MSHDETINSMAKGGCLLITGVYSVLDGVWCVCDMVNFN